MNDLPERINVIRTLTYYVPDVVATLKDMGEEDINLDSVLDYLHDLVYEDMSSSPNILVWQDENGNDL